MTSQRNKLSFEQIVEIIYKYTEEDKTQQEIANEYSVSRECIKYHLRKNGIVCRKNKSTLTPSQREQVRTWFFEDFTLEERRDFLQRYVKRYNVSERVVLTCLGKTKEEVLSFSLEEEKTIVDKYINLSVSVAKLAREYKVSRNKIQLTLQSNKVSLRSK